MISPAENSSVNLLIFQTQKLLTFRQASFEHQREEKKGGSNDEETPAKTLDPIEPGKSNASVEQASESYEETLERLMTMLRNGEIPEDPCKGYENASDTALNALNYKDFPSLCRARAKLSVKSKDPKLNVIFRGHIISMVGTLNLYLDPELSCSWCEALLVAKSLGMGIKNGSKR